MSETQLDPVSAERWLAEQKATVHRLGHEVAVAVDAYLANGQNLAGLRRVEETHQAWKDEILRQVAHG